MYYITKRISLHPSLSPSLLITTVLNQLTPTLSLQYQAI